MAEIVNLREARKAKARAIAEAAAQSARARHGRTKAEKAHDALNAARLENTLGGAKQEAREVK